MVFFDRNYRIATATMTRGVANDVGYMVMLENRLPPGPARDAQRKTAAGIFGYARGISCRASASTRTVVTSPTTVLDRQLASTSWARSLAENIRFRY